MAIFSIAALTGKWSLSRYLSNTIPSARAQGEGLE
jgi:hypothetical protein